MPITRSPRTGLFVALAALATSLPAGAAAMPDMGSVSWTMFKHPQYGCPTKIQLFVSSYATGWPGGDTVSHKITWTVERIKTNGQHVKYKSYDGAYEPQTEQNGKQVTEFSSFGDNGIALGFTANEGFHNRLKLIILKPFHWESDWSEVTGNCF